MRKITIGLLIGILLGLFTGHFITKKIISEPIPKDYVRVTVTNKSGHQITTLTLKHSGGSIEMKTLPDNESAYLIFKNGGENSYRIFATFDNDSTVSSKGEYVEAGYRTKEIILADEVKTERDKD